MKACSMFIGVAAGIAVTTAAIGILYPDVTRRIQRDSKRLLKSASKMKMM